LTAEERDPVALRRAERWIIHRGYAITVVLIFVWPLLSIPARVFTKSYFAFWVLVSIAWGFGAAVIIIMLPLTESADDISRVLSGMLNRVLRREPDVRAPHPEDEKPAEAPEEPAKAVEEEAAEDA